jgi:uncharacterized SAM-dependent methyltransferase
MFQLKSFRLSTSPEEAVLSEFAVRHALRKPGEPVDMRQPYNLYLQDRQAELYLKMMDYTPYTNSCHKAIRELIAENRAELLSTDMKSLEIIDLGPGYPDKTFPLLECAPAQGLNSRYIPVDISRRFLSIASDACKPYGIPIEPKHCLFEELPVLLPPEEPDTARLFIMGVTFMNYTPAEAVALLRSLSGPNTAFLVAAALLPNGPVQQVIAPYTAEDARMFNLLPLDIAGFPASALDYFVRFQNGRVEMGFTLSRDVRIAGVEMGKGEEILTSISYRYQLEEFEAVVRRGFTNVQLAADGAKTGAIAKASLQ